MLLCVHSFRNITFHPNTQSDGSTALLLPLSIVLCMSALISMHFIDSLKAKIDGEEPPTDISQFEGVDGNSSDDANEVNDKTVYSFPSSHFILLVIIAERKIQSNESFVYERKPKNVYKRNLVQMDCVHKQFLLLLFLLLVNLE